MISFIAKELKRLEDYQTLNQNEIEAWIYRVLEANMNKACYATAEEYFEALETNKKVKEVLKRAKKALIVSEANVSYRSKDYSGEETKIKIIQDIEQILKEIK
tara:strand:+ start:7753 stop:8061 length:309 start_codon:yes stop_codon:yes gene_type:complete